MLILSRLGRPTIRPAATFALWQYIDITCKLRPRNTDLLVTGLVCSLNFDLEVLQLPLSSRLIKLCERFISVWILYLFYSLHWPSCFPIWTKGCLGHSSTLIFIVSAATAPQQHDWSGVLSPFTLSVITIGHYCMYEIEQRPFVTYKQRLSIQQSYW